MSLTKQTALLSLEMLSRTFAATYPTHFLGATFDVVSAAMRHANPSVQGSALICQAAICLQLGAKMVPKIPKFMPQVVVLLKKIFAPAKTDEATEEALVKDGKLLSLSLSLVSRTVAVARMATGLTRLNSPLVVQMPISSCCRSAPCRRWRLPSMALVSSSAPTSATSSRPWSPFPTTTPHPRYRMALFFSVLLLLLHF